MPEIHPETRKKLWYIAAFFAIDCAISFYASMTMDPANGYALYAWVSGAMFALFAACITAMLVVTRVAPEDLKQNRVRE
jgi:hypothetical protein